MSVFAARNHRKRPRPAGSTNMTARLRPPHARTASPPRPVLRRSPWRSSCGEQPRLEAERRQGLALGDRGERPVSGRCRGGAEDAEIDARGDVGLAGFSEDVLDHAVVSVPVDGAARPVFGPVVDGQQRSSGRGTRGSGARTRWPRSGSGSPRRRAGSIGVSALGSPGSGSIGVKTSTRRVARDGDPHLAGAVLGAADPPEGQVVQELVGHHDARAVGGHAIEHGHAVDRAQASPEPRHCARPRSPGRAGRRGLRAAGAATCRRPRRPRSGGTGRAVRADPRSRERRRPRRSRTPGGHEGW